MSCFCPFVTGGEPDEQIVDCSCPTCTNCGEVTSDLIQLEDGVEVCPDCLEPTDVDLWEVPLSA